jgi:hypothetical protein
MCNRKVYGTFRWFLQEMEIEVRLDINLTTVVLNDNDSLFSIWVWLTQHTSMIEKHTS